MIGSSIGTDFGRDLVSVCRERKITSVYGQLSLSASYTPGIFGYDLGAEVLALPNILRITSTKEEHV
jgi:hypothetical protein